MTETVAGLCSVTAPRHNGPAPPAGGGREGGERPLHDTSPAGGRIAGFGFSSVEAAPDLADLDANLARIEATGASHCELCLFAHDLIAGGRLIPDRVERLRRICAARTLAYTVHGALAVNFMDTANLDLHEAVCAAMLELCGAVGAGVMVHHPGIVPAATPEALDDLHARERDGLRRMGDRAARLGVRIAVETLFVEEEERYTADAFRLASEIERIDHPNVVGTLDVSHTYIMSTFRGLDFRAAAKRFAAVAGHVHVHDSFGRPRTLKGFTRAEDVAFGQGDLHLPLGWGDIPWDDLMPDLAFLPGTVLNVELPTRFWSELDAVAERMRRLVALAGTRAG